LISRPALHRIRSGEARPLFIKHLLFRPSGPLSVAFGEVCEFLEGAACYALTLGCLPETIALLDARILGSRPAPI